MLKKLAIATAATCTVPLLIPSFRAGFKMGWNDALDQEVRKGTLPIKAYKFKFKTV